MVNACFIKEPREQHPGEANCIGRSPWSSLPFLIEGQLLPLEQIFSGERTGMKRGPKHRQHFLITRGENYVRNFASWGRFSKADKSYMLKPIFFVRSNIFGAQAQPSLFDSALLIVVPHAGI
jgi:hypothetical protein